MLGAPVGGWGAYIKSYVCATRVTSFAPTGAGLPMACAMGYDLSPALRACE